MSPGTRSSSATSAGEGVVITSSMRDRFEALGKPHAGRVGVSPTRTIFVVLVRGLADRLAERDDDEIPRLYHPILDQRPLRFLQCASRS